MRFLDTRFEHSHASGIACCPREFSKSPPDFGDFCENSILNNIISYIKINCSRESDTPLDKFTKVSPISRRICNRILSPVVTKGRFQGNISLESMPVVHVFS